MPQSRASRSKSASSQAEAATAEKQRTAKILRLLKKSYPDVECALIHRNAYELLAATILSAQCTDARVNQTTPDLFAAYPDPFALAKAELADVEQIIRSLGFFRSKAKSLIGMAQGLVERHDGEVPEDLEALCKLPGVGRKTANVLLGVWYNHPSGVVVDTHVKRISRLLGLTKANQPEKIEQELMQKLPRKEWIDFSHRLIYHGRQICIARRPKCRECRLLAVCPRVGLPALPED